jgi:hypothetical protein
MYKHNVTNRPKTQLKRAQNNQKNSIERADSHSGHPSLASRFDAAPVEPQPAASGRSTWTRTVSGRDSWVTLAPVP